MSRKEKKLIIFRERHFKSTIVNKYTGIKIPQRWIVIFTCFLGMINAYTMRICMSMAITQMASRKNHSTIAQFSDDTCPEETKNVSYRNDSFVREDTFDWDEKTQVCKKKYTDTF